MLILNGNSLELSYGWVTLRKEAPYRHLSTSSPVPNPYVTWSRGLRCVFSKGGQNGPRRLGRWGWDYFFLSIYLFFWHCVVIDLYTIILKGWFIKNLSMTCMFVLRWLLFTQNMKIQQKYNYLIFFWHFREELQKMWDSTTNTRYLDSHFILLFLSVDLF